MRALRKQGSLRILRRPRGFGIGPMRSGEQRIAGLLVDRCTGGDEQPEFHLRFTLRSAALIERHLFNRVLRVVSYRLRLPHSSSAAHLFGASAADSNRRSGRDIPG